MTITIRTTTILTTATSKPTIKTTTVKTVVHCLHKTTTTTTAFHRNQQWLMSAMLSALSIIARDGGEERNLFWKIIPKHANTNSSAVLNETQTK